MSTVAVPLSALQIIQLFGIFRQPILVLSWQDVKYHNFTWRNLRALGLEAQALHDYPSPDKHEWLQRGGIQVAELMDMVVFPVNPAPALGIGRYATAHVLWESRKVRKVTNPRPNFSAFGGFNVGVEKSPKICQILLLTSPCKPCSPIGCPPLRGEGGRDGVRALPHVHVSQQRYSARGVDTRQAKARVGAAVPGAVVVSCWSPGTATQKGGEGLFRPYVTLSV